MMSETFLIAVVVTTLGGIVASVLIYQMDHRFHAPPSSATAAETQFPHPRWLHLACIFLVAAYIAFAMWVVAVLAAVLGGVRIGVDDSLLLALFIGLTLGFCAVAYWIHCPACGKHVLLQWTTNPPYVVSGHAKLTHIGQ